jgi:hypothetical protein
MFMTYMKKREMKRQKMKERWSTNRCPNMMTSMDMMKRRSDKMKRMDMMKRQPNMMKRRPVMMKRLTHQPPRKCMPQC